MIIELFKLIGGFVVLIYSGKYLVKGGVSLARNFNLSTLVVGVTIVSFGTSAPELFVSVKAAIDSHPDISMYNVIGSNISNIALVLAITAMILSIPVNKNTIKFDWPFMMLVSIALYVLVLNDFLERWEGILFTSMLILFIVWSVRRSRQQMKQNNEKNSRKPEYHVILALAIVIASSVGLAFSSDWLVDGAVAIAELLNVSERAISVSLIAIGTSIPELATSAIAAIKKEMDISVGNIIGSNIYNILGVLGITSIIHPIKVNPLAINFDIFWMLGISLLLLLLMFPLKKPVLNRWKGFLMLVIYVGYMYLIFKRK